MTTQEQIHRIESTLRGLEYIDELPSVGFRAFNHSMDGGFTHIDGVRHKITVNERNMDRKLRLAFRECPRMARINSLAVVKARRDAQNAVDQVLAELIQETLDQRI